MLWPGRHCPESGVRFAGVIWEGDPWPKGTFIFDDVHGKRQLGQPRRDRGHQARQAARGAADIQRRFAPITSPQVITMSGTGDHDERYRHPEVSVRVSASGSAPAGCRSSADVGHRSSAPLEQDFRNPRPGQSERRRAGKLSVRYLLSSSTSYGQVGEAASRPESLQWETEAAACITRGASDHDGRSG
jgi:hypothetical protein